MISNTIFDPLGMCQPYLLPGRRILQEVCEAVSGWDEHFPPGLETLPNLECLSIPRCYTAGGRFGTFQIHTFMDATTIGLGAVTYLHVHFMDDDTTETAFLMGKSKIVSKNNNTSVPKLELRAAILGSKIHKKIKDAIRLQIEKAYLWTDSTAVLKWITSKDGRFSKYVARNVAAIELRTMGDEFKYVPTASNPADIASRGESPSKASSDSMWIKASNFLRGKEDEWPHLEEKASSADKANDVEDVTLFVTSLKEETETVISAFVINREESDFEPLICCTAHQKELSNVVLELDTNLDDKYASPPNGRMEIMPAVICDIVHPVNLFGMSC